MLFNKDLLMKNRFILYWLLFTDLISKFKILSSVHSRLIPGAILGWGNLLFFLFFLFLFDFLAEQDVLIGNTKFLSKIVKHFKELSGFSAFILSKEYNKALDIFKYLLNFGTNIIGFILSINEKLRKHRIKLVVLNKFGF